MAKRISIINFKGGVGKTTIAAQAESLLIDCENGANAVQGLARTPYLATWLQMREWLIEIAGKGAGESKVVAIDTIDWMVQRIIEYVISDLDGDQSLTNTLGKSHGGFMKGREVVQNIVYRELLPMLNAINNRGIGLLLLAHAKNEKSTNAEGIERKGAVPAIPEWIRPAFTEWVDAILYARPERTLVTECTNLIFAKNRYQFPAEMPLSWPAIAGEISSLSNTENSNGQS